MTLINKMKDFGELFRTDIILIKESQLNIKEKMKQIVEKQLGKTYLTGDDLKNKQEKIFNYKFEI